MNRQFYFSKFLPYSILFVTFYTILPYPAPYFKYMSFFKNTFVWWIIIFAILFVFSYSKRYYFNYKNKNIKIITIYLFWNWICILRGIFIAEIYWDWKALIENAMALSLPIVAYVATNKHFTQSILSKYIKYAIPPFIIFFFILDSQAYGFYLVPIYFLAIFFPALPYRWKIYTILISIFVMIINLDARSNVVKFGVVFLSLPIYYFRRSINMKIIEVVRISLIALPLLLFILGYSGVFNVFKMDEYINGNYETKTNDITGNSFKADLKADTRTDIYYEVIQSAKKNSYFIWGRTPARGNDTDIYFDQNSYSGRAERLSNEVAILNVFTWTGVIGVILYLIVFYSATSLALNKSNNVYVKILAIYIAFRWLYAWVEDINHFSLTTFMLWVMIGTCYSVSFRRMSNKEVEFWVKGIFDKKYNSFVSMNSKKNQE